mgnify:CR=1 FL=1
MRKTIKHKILISILAMSSVNLFASAEVFAVDVTVDYNKVTSHNNETIKTGVDFNGYEYTKDKYNNNNITISNSTLGNFYGISLPDNENERTRSLTNNNITINGSTIIGNITGIKAATHNLSATGLTLTLKEDTTVNGEVVGADLSSYGNDITVNNIKIVLEGNTKINNADVILFRRSTWAHYPVNMSNCEIILRDNADVSTSNLFAFTSTDNVPNDGYAPKPIKPKNATLTLDGWSGTVNSLHDFDIINFNNIDLSKDTRLDVTGNVVNMSDVSDVAININSIAMAGDYKKGVNNHFVSWDEDIKGTVTIAGEITNNLDTDNYYTADRNGNDGIYATKFNGLTVSDSTTSNNQIEISADIENSVLTGKFIDESGTVHFNSDQTENTASLTIGKGFTTNVAILAGAYAANKTDGTEPSAEKGIVNISGTTDWKGTVYAGYSESGSVNNNTINIAAGTNAKDMTLKGYNSDSAADGSAASSHTGNTLNITGNGSTFNSIEDFETINFNGIKLNGADVLTLNSANLTGTILNVESLASGETFKAGDTVTLISGNIEGTPTLTHDKVTAGLSQDLSVEEITNNSSVKLSVKDVSLNDQIDLVAENRAVATAFVNQGTDLISDSLDTISRDSNYGVKTFAAVHGNRSKYDVNSDIKINGWSVIAGVGNADKFDNGSKFSWGVFYENGSGNYRTYNEFNNEFFRGDGSLVYNGGGIAARYTNKNGVYTEGSLRAGMLKSDMDNALRDGAGNFYGYESESAYYGAHLGIGKIISLSENSDLDVYGKFFHTYTEGDSFKVAGDEFEFDSINSDRLRIGARITSNKENKFSTYYGLAYEYEFNGDADMTAQGLKAPTQSLQGSSVMAEVGFNYQPTPDSPWSFDLNMRGYTGERQGGSFNVQATYTF